MWRKPAEAKASSQPVETAVPAVAKETAETPAVAESESSTPVGSAAATAPSASSATSPSSKTSPTAPASSLAQAVTPVPVSQPGARGISRISSGIRIKGDISGNDDLYIDGQAEGQFNFPEAKVTVGPNGKVKANIEAREIVVEGTVNGDLKASAGVQLGASSRVQGSLTTPRIAIDDGARLRGKVEMMRAKGGASTLDTTTIAATSAAVTSETPKAIAKASGE